MIEELLDRHAAFIAGYELGAAHGRADERATIDLELQARRAATRAMRISERPEVDPALQAARAQQRRDWGWE